MAKITRTDASKFIRWLVLTIEGCVFLNFRFVPEYLVPYNWVPKFIGVFLLTYASYILFCEKESK